MQKQVRLSSVQAGFCAKQVRLSSVKTGFCAKTSEVIFSACGLLCKAGDVIFSAGGLRGGEGKEKGGDIWRFDKILLILQEDEKGKWKVNSGVTRWKKN